MSSKKENPSNSNEDYPTNDYLVGKRSITSKVFKSRFELLRDKQTQNKKSRPYFYIALVIIFLILSIPVYSFFTKYVKPPTEIALRVNDKEYTRGDVVDYIRFNQRITEDLGMQFQIGTSLFDAMQTLQDNEIAYQLAPRHGIIVESEEVDDYIETLLGYVFEKNSERNEEQEINFEESKRQFINKIGLPEEVYRDFIRKTMFKERLRSVVADTVSRIQPQVHIYEIAVPNPEAKLMRNIERDLIAGKPIVDITLFYSKDPDIKRYNGETGWFPYGVLLDLDYFLFGLNKEGERILPVRKISPVQYDEEKQIYKIYIIEEISDAREVNDSNFEALVDRAMVIFLNKERKKIASEGNLYMDLNDKIYGWVNQQVRLSTLLPTPTGSQYGQNLITADQLK